MTPAEAKQHATNEGFEFRWDPRRRLYALTDPQGQRAVSYHTRKTLDPLSEHHLRKAYLMRTCPECSGSGSADDNKYDPHKCHVCGGEGKV